MTDSARSSFLYSRDMHSSKSTEAIGKTTLAGVKRNPFPRTLTWKAGHLRAPLYLCGAAGGGYLQEFICGFRC